MESATNATGKVAALRADESCSSAAIEFKKCILSQRVRADTTVG
jgi:hypothetical protein